MKNTMKKIDHYFDISLEIAIKITTMVLIPLLLATPLVLLIGGIMTLI